MIKALVRSNLSGINLPDIIIRSIESKRSTLLSSPFRVLRTDVISLLVDLSLQAGPRRLDFGGILSNHLTRDLISGWEISLSDSKTAINVGDAAARWIENLIKLQPNIQVDTFVVNHLLDICLYHGCGHSDIEYSKFAHSVILRTAQQIRRAVSVGRSSDFLRVALKTFVNHASHPSFHVRETGRLFYKLNNVCNKAF